MPAGSKGGGPTTVTARTKWPVNWQGDKPEAPEPELRGKLRRPRDPRKIKKIAVRPPRRSPLAGKGGPYKNERKLVYEPEEYYPVDEQEEE